MIYQEGFAYHIKDEYLKKYKMTSSCRIKKTEHIALLSFAYVILKHRFCR